MKLSREFALELVEQVVAVYVVTFIGLLISSGFGMDGTARLDVVAVSAISAIPAALSVIKSFAAKFVGDSESALLLPKKTDNVDPF